MTPSNDLKQEGAEGASMYQSVGPMNVNNFNGPTALASYTKLANEYKKERLDPSSIICEIIEKIQHFSKNIDTEIIGLEQKLRNGGFENESTFALELKERYTMFLTTNDLSNATQKIHAYLLAKIYVAFNLYVPTAVAEGKSTLEIHDIILSKIVTPVENILGVDNVLDLYDDDVMAMIYFLTGNCYIKWEANANISPSI